MKKFDGINVVPFIDIMLVLLVIVLVTATFIKKGAIKVDLPNATSSKPIKNSKSLQITISKDNKIYLDKNLTSLNEIKNSILRYDKNTTIDIICDKSAKFDSFVNILDILKSNSYNHINIVTKNE